MSTRVSMSFRHWRKYNVCVDKAVLVIGLLHSHLLMRSVQVVIIFKKIKLKTCARTRLNFLILNDFWCRSAESNRRPTDYESVALPTELLRLLSFVLLYLILLSPKLYSGHLNMQDLEAAFFIYVAPMHQ